MRLAAIEGGGTKFVLAIGDHEGNLYKRIEIPTKAPEETMDVVIDFFKNEEFEAMGVGCFGPIDPNVESETYGYITETPKVMWKNYNIIGKLKEHFDVPIKFDTDVNGAALGELKWGAAKGLDSSVYVTVGTGIGGGAVAGGKMINGLLHPEMGHIFVRRHPEDSYKGNCDIHGDCLEGLACGPAIEERWGISAKELPVNHKAWEIQAHYLAQAVVNYILILSPQKIILGGGVMKQKQLFPLIREKVKGILNGFIKKDEIINDIENYIVSPGLIDNAGICGALALAQIALEKK